MYAQHLIFASELLNQTLPDGGPVYTETDLSRFIVEPWNAVSSLFIVVPAVIWLVRLRKKLARFRFMMFCIPLMILGGMGSTFFHAFRASGIFLVMDVLPSAMLSLSLSIYFWLKVLRKWWYVIGIVVLFFVPRWLLWGNLPRATAINVSYGITGTVAALPIIIILFRNSFDQWVVATLTLMFFILALVFREQDPYPNPLFPQGTHFLWHVFSGFGAFTILAYIYRFRNRELKEQALH